MPPSPDTAVEEFADALTALRAKAGTPSFRSIARSIDQMLDGEPGPSNESIRQMHEGRRSPHAVSLEALAGLQAYYHASPDELGPVAAHRLRAVRELVSQNLKILNPSGIDIRDSTLANRRHDDGLKIAV